MHNLPERNVLNCQENRRKTFKPSYTDEMFSDPAKKQ